MEEHEVARAIIKQSGLTQHELATRMGLSGPSSIGALFRGTSMRVDTIVKILNACGGYEMVVRARDGNGPEYVIGEDPEPTEKEPDLVAQPAPSENDAEMAKMFEAFKEWYKENKAAES